MNETPITYREAAKIAGVSQETIRRWHIAGRRREDGACIKLRAATRYGKRVTTREWLEAFKTEFDGRMESSPTPSRQSRSLSLADRRKRAKRLYGNQAKAMSDVRRSREDSRAVPDLLVSGLLPGPQEKGCHRIAVSGHGADAPAARCPAV